MTHLERFIKDNENWLDLIQLAPYNINVKEKDGYKLLKYNQLADNTDWYSPIVRECRGIILNDKNEIVCHAFDRFYNYGEPYADDVNFAQCVVQEKVDGSIIKLWSDDGKLHISTNGAIDAYDVALASISFGKSDDTFGAKVAGILSSRLNIEWLGEYLHATNQTAIFELISPQNQIVVYYPEEDLVYLGSRDLGTNQEYFDGNFDQICRRPDEYSIDFNFTSIDDIKAFVDTLKGLEGVVVRDASYRRVKVKNAEYLIAHHNLKAIRDIDLIDVVLRGEVEEYKATLINPEFQDRLDRIKDEIEILFSQVAAIITSDADLSRKEFALKWKDNPLAPLLFKGLGGKNFRTAVSASTIAKILRGE